MTDLQTGLAEPHHAPPIDDLARQIGALTWCHPLELQGVQTRPQWHVRRRFERRLKFLQLPADLTGKTVLDIGAWDGFFSFECERRGAARVVAVDSFAWDHHGKEGFLLAHRVLNSKVEHRHMTAEEIDARVLGTFDLVLFLGVLYHLRSPIGVLERLRAVTTGTLVCETHALVPAFHERYPLISFFPGDGLELGVPHEFCAIPTMECLTQMLRAAGFTRLDVKHTPSLRWLKRLKAAVTNRPQSGRAIVHAA
jgi:tRNA (mo5U34)-methyltransferase